MCTSGAISTIDAHGKPVILLVKTSDFRRVGNWYGLMKGTNGHDVVGGNRIDVPGIYAGLNSAGLSVCRTYFDYRERSFENPAESKSKEDEISIDTDRRGLICASMIESCGSVEEGIDYLERVLPQHCHENSGQKGVSFILADAAGNIGVLESCNGRMASKIYEQGIVARANNGCLIGLEEQELLPTEIKRDRKERYEAILSTLNLSEKELKENISKEQIIEKIKTATGWHGPDGSVMPGAICSHGINVPGARTSSSDKFYTNSAVIFDVGGRKMFHASGPPCSSSWRTVDLN